MTLAPGTTLGPYKILAPLGAGGMGEVYRAHDTRLGRDVAIKVLPQSLSTHAEVRARFEREAKMVSSLNHPHICTLHDIGREGDTDYLVMELVEGETLAARLAKGPLPVADVLRLGAQIADALSRAHRAGVIHRDLKPGNVMLTRSAVTLMDFGLARATGLAGAGSGTAAAALTQSPTIAQPLTAEGTLVGTFQYMAPEQLEGREADARADLWALGCVLYEMATGRHAFEGRSQASLISSIMKEEPRPLVELAPMSPPALDRLVRHCLAKDPDDRIQTAHDVKLQLEEVAASGPQAGATSAASVTGVPARRTGRREQIAWSLAVVAAVIAAGLLWQAAQPSRRGDGAALVRFAMTAPPGARLGTMDDGFAISPDGKLLAFEASDSNGVSSIWIRGLDGLTAGNLNGTENALGGGLFWSPDSRSLGFFAGGKLKKIAISGGSPEVLCDAASGRGGSWSRDNIIIFAPQAIGGLFRISAGGGKVEEVLGPDASRQETALRYPYFLPDGKQFLFLSLPRRQGNFEIHLGALGSKERVPLMRAGAAPVWAEPGYIVTERNRRLVAQRFDPATRKLVGEPLDIRDAPLIQGFYGVPVVSASLNGVLAYSASRLANTQVAWWDRAGRRHGVLPLPPGRWESVSIAPYGRRALIGRRNSSSDTEQWLVDLKSGVASRVAPAVIDDGDVGWSPAGDRVAYLVNRNGPEDIYIKSLEGGGPETPLVVSEVAFKAVYQWTPDGRYVVYSPSDPKTGFDVWRVPVDGDRKPEPLVRTEANESGGWVSPDGRWLAYVSDESGRDEIYAQSYPAPARRQQLTTTGLRDWYGSYVVNWSHDGRELILFNGDVRALEIEPGPALRVGVPRRLFATPAGVVGFGVMPDHQRFLVSEPVGDVDADAIGLDLNWAAALGKR